MPRARVLLRRALPFVVPLALVLVLLGPMLVGTRSLASTNRLYEYWPWAMERPADIGVDTFAPFSDTWDHVFPRRIESADRLGSGDLPEWTDYVGGGSTLATDPGGFTWAPSNLIWMAVPGWYAPGLVKALELLAAWGFLYLFARRVSVGRAGAALGGLVFAVSGFQVAWINWQHTTVNMWVAASLWSWDRVRERPRAPDRIAVAALTTGATFLEGFPAVAIIGLGAVAAVMVLRVVASWPGWRDALRSAGGVTAAAVLGAGLSMAVMLPFSERLGEFEFQRETAADHHQNRTIATVLSPNSLGTADRYFGAGNFVEAVGYLAPVIVAVLAAGTVIALADRRRRILTVGTVLGGTWLLLYSYGFEPFYDALRWLPIFNSNAPGRAKATASILLAAATALCIDALARTTPSRRVRAVAAGASAVAVAGCLLFLRDVLARSAPSMHDFIRGEVIRASLVLLAGLAATAILLWRHRLPSVLPRVAVGSLLVLVLIDASAWIRPYWPSSRPEDFYPQTEAHRYLQEHLGDDRVASLGSTFFAGTNSVYGVRTVQGHVFQIPPWKELVTAAGARFVTPTNSTFDEPADAGNPALDRLGATFWADPPNAPRCEAPAPGPSTGATELEVGDSVTGPGTGGRGVTVTLAEGVTVDTIVTIVTSDGQRGSTLLGRGLAAGDTRYLAVPEPTSPADERTYSVEAVDGPPLKVLDHPEGALAACTAPVDGLTLVFSDGATIYRRDRALPRARWASEAVVIEDPAARLAALANGDFAASEVVVGEPVESPGGGDGRVEALRIDGDHQAYRVESDGPGWLVVADPLQAGWTASVDGEAADIVPADHGVVAIALPEGVHRVDLRADPRGAAAGLAASAASATVVAGLLGWAAVQRLRRRSRSTDSTPEPATADGSPPTTVFPPDKMVT